MARRVELDGDVDAGDFLAFFVRHQADHLAHRAEARAVDEDFVGRLDDGAAVERVVVGHRVFHLQAA